MRRWKMKKRLWECNCVAREREGKENGSWCWKKREKTRGREREVETYGQGNLMQHTTQRYNDNKQPYPKYTNQIIKARQGNSDAKRIYQAIGYGWGWFQFCL